MPTIDSMIIRKNLKILRDEVETALRVFYAYEQISKLLAEERYVYLINKNGHFWRIFISSVHTKLFMALGRLYDDSGGAFSFHQFIKLCRDNISEFARDYLETRKLDGHHTRPSYLDEYLEKAYYASPADIQKLAQLAKPFNKRLRGVYREIRNKVIAHAIHTDTNVASALFQDTNFNEIETVLTVMWSIYNQIWMLYENGHQPSFSIEPYQHKDEVVDSVEHVLSATAS